MFHGHVFQESRERKHTISKSSLEQIKLRSGRLCRLWDTTEDTRATYTGKPWYFNHLVDLLRLGVEHKNLYCATAFGKQIKLQYKTAEKEFDTDVRTNYLGMTPSFYGIYECQHIEIINKAIRKLLALTAICIHGCNRIWGGLLWLCKTLVVPATTYGCHMKKRSDCLQEWWYKLEVAIIRAFFWGFHSREETKNEINAAPLAMTNIKSMSVLYMTECIYNKDMSLQN